MAGQSERKTKSELTQRCFSIAKQLHESNLNKNCVAVTLYVQNFSNIKLSKQAVLRTQAHREKVVLNLKLTVGKRCERIFETNQSVMVGSAAGLYEMNPYETVWFQIELNHRTRLNVFYFKICREIRE